jgi:glucokinase
MGVLVGIDVGGTKIASAVSDASGRLLATARQPTRPSGDGAADVAALAGSLPALLAEAGSRLAEVDAIGVSLPGPLDPERGVLLDPPNLPGWHDLPVRDLLADAFGVPVFIENDANAAALAEWHFGAARGFEHVVYLTMSTGVGGGLILGGRLHRGVLASAGEVGHMPIEWDGALCACGRRGCFEAYVGGASWAKHLRAVTPATSRVAALAGGTDSVTPRHVVAAAREGDAFAVAELDRWNDYVARGITSLAFVLAPQAVVLGTIATAAGEALSFAPIRARVAERIWPFLAERLQILPSSLGDALPYHAAIGVAFEGLRTK